MSRRLQLQDSKQHLLTIVMDSNWLDFNGTWLPDAPGYVVASTSKADNTYTTYTNAADLTMLAYLYTLTADQSVVKVMRLDGLADNFAGAPSPIWNDSGSGELFKEGANILVAGALSWKLL